MSRGWMKRDSYSRDGGVDEHERVQGGRVENSGKDRTVSSRKAASPKKELLAQAQPGVRQSSGDRVTMRGHC
eukprot:6187511-Pleurochrysis_carterae.AAC.2